MESPNTSPAISLGTSSVDESILVLDFAVPSLLSSSRYAAPTLAELPEPVPPAPTAMSGIPSPSMSPVPVTPEPKLSPLASTGPPPVPLAIFACLSTEPSAFIITTYAAPRFLPPVSSLLAPTATSGTPSSLMSPMEAIAYPSSSPPETGRETASLPTGPAYRASPLPAGAGWSRRTM